MKLLFTLLTFIFFTTPLIIYGQYNIPYSDASQEITGRTLLVCTYKGKLYRGAEPDDDFKKLLSKTWQHGPVLFVDSSFADSVIIIGDTSYALLKGEMDKNISSGYSTGIAYPGSYNNSSSFAKMTVSKTGKEGIVLWDDFMLTLEIVRRPKVTRQLSQTRFEDTISSKLDYYFSVQQFSRLVDAGKKRIPVSQYYNPEENQKIISQSTLLLPKEFFKKNDLNLAVKEYPFNYRIVSISELDSLILNQVENVIYPKLICNYFQAFRKPVWVLVHSNGKILSMAKNTLNAQEKTPEIITLKNMKTFLSLKDQTKLSIYVED